MVVNETGVASLKCDVKGNPNPQITWLQKNTSLPADKRIVQSHGGLMIKNLTSQDGGLYTCVASNILGLVKTSATLTVQVTCSSFVTYKNVHGLEAINSFSLYRRKNLRAKRASGGITLLVKEQLFQGVTICKCDDDRFLWWKLVRNFFGLTDDIFVCSVYLPPYTSKTYVPESNKDRINCFITFRDQLSYFGKKGKLFFAVTLMHALETCRV